MEIKESQVPQLLGVFERIRVTRESIGKHENEISKEMEYLKKYYADLRVLGINVIRNK